MTKILPLLVVLLSLLGTQKVFACEGKERQVGPICVETSTPKTGSFNVFYQKAHFDDDSTKRVVWQGNGYVDEATRTQLVVIEKRMVEGQGLADVEVIYNWNGQRFVEKH